MLFAQDLTFSDYRPRWAQIFISMMKFYKWKLRVAADAWSTKWFLNLPSLLFIVIRSHKEKSDLVCESGAPPADKLHTKTRTTSLLCYTLQEIRDITQRCNFPIFSCRQQQKDEELRDSFTRILNRVCVAVKHARTPHEMTLEDNYRFRHFLCCNIMRRRKIIFVLMSNFHNFRFW